MAGKVDPYTGQPKNNPYEHAALPVDDSASLANHAYHVAVNQLKDQRSETLSYYGMGAGGRLDPNNPYGQRQVLERQQSQDLNSLANAQQQAGLYGGMGGLGGNKGLGAQQRGQALFAQGQQTSDLLKAFQDRLHSINVGMTEARWQGNEHKVSGTLQAIMNAISAGAFTPAAPVGS